MLPRSQRLDTAAFGRAFDGGRVLRHPLLTLRLLNRQDGRAVTRAAFVVSRKHGKAVVRNRLRRRLREQFRLSPQRANAALEGRDLIFLAGAGALTSTNEQLAAALGQLLERAARTSLQPTIEKRAAGGQPSDGTGV